MEWIEWIAAANGDFAEIENVERWAEAHALKVVDFECKSVILENASGHRAFYDWWTDRIQFLCLDNENQHV